MDSAVVPADMQELARLVRAIRSTLAWLVEGSTHIPEALRPAFSVVLPDILERLAQISQSIESITDSDELYARLAEEGLTGAHLEMKSQVGKAASDALAAAPSIGAPGARGGRAEPARVSRFLRPVLNWINSLLGSLEKVFPPAGAVREFKEQAEVAVEFGNSIDAPPREVLP